MGTLQEYLHAFLSTEEAVKGIPMWEPTAISANSVKSP